MTFLDTALPLTVRLLRPVHGAPDDSENALVILGGGRDSDEDVTELGVADDTTLNPRISESLRTILPKAFPQFFDKDTEPEMEWVCPRLL
jgi:hypothetical protein